MTPTISKLREDIDRGRGGDKVNVADPAAAPLGTGEEAAGTPVPPEAVATAYAQEIRPAPITSEKKDDDHAVAIYVFLIAAIVGTLTCAIWLSAPL
jgi:hypothetical protein